MFRKIERENIVRIWVSDVPIRRFLLEVEIWATPIVISGEIASVLRR